MLDKIFGQGKTRQGFFWILYDFANSIAVVVFFLYFSQWLVVENGIADIWYNLIFTASSILLVFSSPILGIIADKTQRRMPYLAFSTLMFFLCLVTVSLIALFVPYSTGAAFTAAGIYMLANYFYQLSFSFYNPMLSEVAAEEKQGLVSGLGQSANWLGMIAGILISLPLIGGTIYLFGHGGRAQTFLPATIIFFALSLPALFFLKDKTPQKIPFRIKHEYKNYFKSFFNLIKNPGIGAFLLGYFFFNDAVITLQNNYPIYMEQVFGVSDKIKSILLLGILVTSAIGAFFGGYVADKIGRKKILTIILVLWIILFPMIGSLKILPIFYALTVVMGLLYGATWSVARALMLKLTPKDSLNHAFSYYTLAERFSTFVGPVAWGTITYFLAGRGAVRYQIAAVSLTIFVVIGLVLVNKIPKEKMLPGSQNTPG